MKKTNNKTLARPPAPRTNVRILYYYYNTHMCGLTSEINDFLAPFQREIP